MPARAGAYLSRWFQSKVTSAPDRAAVRIFRPARIMDGVEGISQKSLTKTLRGLERDGLITREVFAEVPPRVEYTNTALGAEMLDNVAPLWLWVAKGVQRF